MANPAQLINTIHSLFLAYEDKFIVTPNYHVFEMYAAHQGAQALRTEFISPRVSFTRADKPADFWGLSGSASLNGKELTLTAVNPDAKNARETEVNVRGARVMEARARCFLQLIFTLITVSQIRVDLSHEMKRSTLAAAGSWYIGFNLLP